MRFNVLNELSKEDPDRKLLRFYLNRVQQDLLHPELERRHGKLKLRRLLIKRLMEIHKRPIRENREDEHTRP